MAIRFFTYNGWNDKLEVAVDTRPQVLRLAIDPYMTHDEMMRGDVGIRSDVGGIRTINFDTKRSYSAAIYPSIVAMPGRGNRFVAASVLAQKTKVVDDGIVAAIEVLTNDGRSSFPGRAPFLRGLQELLRAQWAANPDEKHLAEAIGLVAALRSLNSEGESEEEEGWPTALKLRKGRHLREIRQECAGDIPLGIYSWDARFGAIYRQGKALQLALEPALATLLADAIAGDATTRESYRRLLALANLTNPFVRPTLLEDRTDSAIFPASESLEGQIVKLLFGNSPIPPGFDLIGELIARVVDRTMSLAPTSESGWYDHVVHSLEPLLIPERMPEAAKLRFDASYQSDLRDLFRSLLALTRETHIKQLETPRAGGAPLVVSPHLTFEPLAEHYLRRAQSYRFVRERLLETVGEDALRGQNCLRQSGDTGVSILDELIGMERLYVGAWAIVHDEIGMPIKVADATELAWIHSARADARAWRIRHLNDPDLAEDVRMMVPLYFDIERKEWEVLAMLGYEQRNLRATFEVKPDVTIRDSRGELRQHEIVWSRNSFPLPRPVTVTCRTRRLLNREQFRGLCKEHVTIPAIVAAVEALEPAC